MSDRMEETMQMPAPGAVWRDLFQSAENESSHPPRRGLSETEKAKLMRFNENAKMLILMVGKPSRKTRVAGKLKGYLSWLGYKVKLIKTSAYRLKFVGKVGHDFFDPSNAENARKRQQYNSEALNDAIQFLRGSYDVVILDSAHQNSRIRHTIIEKLKVKLGEPSAYQHYENIAAAPDKFSYRLLWVESFCEKLDIVESNFLEIDRRVREDYQHKTDAEALQMFWEKVRYFDQDYETLSVDSDRLYEDELDRLRYNSFIKIKDFGKTMTLHHVQGFLESKIATFCSYIHTRHRAIVLVRHGESEFNPEERIGGNPALTERGQMFALELAKYLQEQLACDFRPDKVAVPDSKRPKASIWTSNLKRTTQTGEKIDGQMVSWVALAEIDAGEFDGRTMNEIKENHLNEWAQRESDRLNYRWPQGESYIDVKKRIQKVVFELERQRNHVVVISHRTVLRCLYSYFMDIEPEETPFVEFPLHHVVVLRPNLIGWSEEWVSLPPHIEVRKTKTREPDPMQLE